MRYLLPVLVCNDAAMTVEEAQQVVLAADNGEDIEQETLVAALVTIEAARLRDDASFLNHVGP